MRGEIVECAVRFDMTQDGALRAGKGGDGAELIEHHVFDFDFAHFEDAPPKARKVWIAGIRADADTVCFGERDGTLITMGSPP